MATWPPVPGPVRAPSGLFPAGPPRPVFREGHPANVAAVLSGAGAGALWMLLFGLIGTDERSYLWSTIVAAGVAWIAAGVLARFGDRGVATGVALSSGAGLAIAGLVIVITWAGGQWPLW